MAKFTELACFEDDYVATNMAKVRKFEDGLNLSIRGKITGLLLHDMDSMVRIAMTIERERERLMTHGISGMWVLLKREGRASLPPAWGRSRELLFRKDFRDKVEVIRAKAKMGHLARRGRRLAWTL